MSLNDPITADEVAGTNYNGGLDATAAQLLIDAAIADMTIQSATRYRPTADGVLSLPENTEIPIPMSVVESDTGNFDSAGDPTLFTIQEDGVYQVTACAGFTQDSSQQQVTVWIEVNTVRMSQVTDANTGFNGHTQVTTGAIPLSAGDTVRTVVYRSDAGTAANDLYVAEGRPNNWMSIIRLDNLTGPV